MSIEFKTKKRATMPNF